MKIIIRDIALFFDNISSNSMGIDIDQCSRTEVDRYISGMTDYYDKVVHRTSNKIKKKTGVDIPDNYNYLYFLQGQGIRWSRQEKEHKEGYLSGGFCVNGVIDAFLYPIEFWERPVRKFHEIGCDNLVDRPENMRWFESTTAHNDPAYTPYYGCVLFKPPTFPNKLFFYDSGLLFPLPFTSLEEYFTAMINSAAVQCWQYFYIEPMEIINKTRGVNYITWPLHGTTHIDRNMRNLIVDKTIKYDRLDLINEYLERCVRLLPETFPFIDFSHHREYYSRFKELYEKQ